MDGFTGTIVFLSILIVVLLVVAFLPNKKETK